MIFLYLRHTLQAMALGVTDGTRATAKLRASPPRCLSQNRPQRTSLCRQALIPATEPPSDQD